MLLLQILYGQDVDLTDKKNCPWTMLVRKIYVRCPRTTILCPLSVEPTRPKNLIFSQLFGPTLITHSIHFINTLIITDAFHEIVSISFKKSNLFFDIFEKKIISKNFFSNFLKIYILN
jgi:hypothetical protein